MKLFEQNIKHNMNIEFTIAKKTIQYICFLN